MILVTGTTGFLGREIIKRFPAGETKTLNRSQGDYRLSLADTVPVFREKFEMVVHVAGKAHLVPKTKEEADAFYAVNLKGTRNLLEGLTEHPPSFFILISTVAVYGLSEGSMITEEHPLQATDPYGESKKLAEQEVVEWCLTHHVKYTILRLPLIAGGDPPGNLKKMIGAIKKGYYFNIGKGQTRKSMVLATDVAGCISEAAKVGGIYNLTDGAHPSMAEISNCIATQLKVKRVRAIPAFMVKLVALCGDLLGRKAPVNSQVIRKMTSDLTFDDSKARRLIKWNPNAVIEQFRI